ncbi:Coenzyme F420 hydrogenase/dehydrogenase, beta subunit C-terminal domain [Mycolicibacterium monacense]|uniref:Coenzyme F420 hydrogenase/dehydrogenase, beta subunit C-terminal domain n=1 Tax=Mycolicibacterium monacense TaxID=85693 RepID=UPI000A74EB34|nr:Coenzyme F420 hydrogenase/dehydrogenase, beta subunit C-terminal domain [Mycolicibacterium monacense]
MGRPVEEGSFKSTVIAHRYDVGSGVMTALNPRVTTALNQYGQFVSEYDASASEIDDHELQSVSAMADGKMADEDALAQRLFASTTGAKYEPIIGYYRRLFAGHVIEGSFRREGSSGGFATWVLCELLKRDLVDYVIHVKPTYTRNDLLFKYTVSDDIERIKAGSGSRYYPVELSSVLETVKSTPGRYAVVGIPSLLMELRLLAEVHKVVGERLCFTVGLICGHQKSTKYAESLAWQCGIRPGDLRYFNFRKKVTEGRASTYNMEMVGLKDGREVTISKKDYELFGSNWGHGFFKAKFSDFTDDALNETADIAIGDAWLEEYVNDPQGNNILIVRNEVILDLIEKGIAERRLKLDELTPAAIIRSQTGLLHHTRDELGYRLARCEKRAQWRPSKRLPADASLPILRRAVQDTRERISELSHVYYAQAVERGDWFYFEAKMRPFVRRYEWLYALQEIRKNAITPQRVMRVLRRRAAGRGRLRLRRQTDRSKANSGGAQT